MISVEDEIFYARRSTFEDFIKKEMLKMLPFKIHNPISEFERGFGACIDITKQNISNYTIERSGE